MQISIQNYRGCKSAAVRGAPILIVGGRNGNGKSSLLEGVAMAVTGHVTPQGVAKKDAGVLLYRLNGMRASKGVISVTLEDGAAHLSLPKGEVRTEGDLKVSAVAAGLVRIPALPADKLAAVIGPFVHAEPNLDDVLKTFKEKGIDAQWAGSVWARIQKERENDPRNNGWDQAYLQAQQKGRDVKARWTAVTGKKWGTEAGASWRPEGWSDELLTDETSDSDVADLYYALREAEKASAFDEGMLDALNEDIKALPERQLAVHEAVAAEESALTSLRAAEAALAKLPEPEVSGNDLPCPHCGCFVRLDRKNAATLQLVKAEDSTHLGDGVDRMRMDRAAAEGDLANRREAYTKATAAALEAKNLLLVSTNARDRLTEATKATGAKVDVDAARAAHDDAKRRVATRDAYLLASGEHATIIGNALIQEILAPSGLRAEVLKRGLEAFNSEHLAPLCELAGLPAVTIGEDLVVVWTDAKGARAWWELSGGEKWLASAILQIAVARADGSRMVILDGADILDAGNRNALFSLLPEIGIEGLVGMTYNKPGQVPDISAAELGQRFWMRDGTSEEISA